MACSCGARRSNRAKAAFRLTRTCTWLPPTVPNSVDQPGVITGAQNAWYGTGGVVDDHEYGNTYPRGGQGGGGADMPYADPGQPAYQPGGHKSALWGRLSGDWTSQDTSFTNNGSTFDTSFDQHAYSLLAGLEMRPPDDNNGWRLGVFGGWMSSGLTFNSYGASTDYDGGTVGAYAAYINGPWHSDAEFKADFLGVTYSSPSVSASTDATNLGVRANVAYRVENGAMFYEPIASFAMVNSSLGSASGGGGTINYSDGLSIRGGIGGRIGTTYALSGGERVDFDVMGKLWNEFGGANTVTVSDGFTTQSFTDSISGVFGEVVGRATIYSADRSMSGFASVGGTFSSNATTVSGKVGARKSF